MKNVILLMLFFFSITLTQAQVPQSERDALIALYNATDGPNWYDNTNWNTSYPVSTWYNVTVSNINGQDHVTNLFLYNNNLTGTIPPEFCNLSQLTLLSLNNNNLTGVLPSEFSNLNNLVNIHIYNNHFSGLFPDISNSPVLKDVDIYKNDFQFADLEPTYTAIKARCEGNGGFYEYIPMNKLESELIIDMVNGTDYTFSMPTIAGTNVTYQWYKNGIPIPNATSQTYNIANAQHSDLGDYTCKAQSSIITDLIIVRNTIHVYGTVDAGDKAALLALYNSTGGSNWIHHTNWNSTQPVYTWYGVKMRGDRVSEINLYNNNLNGSLSPDIGDLTGLEILDLSSNGSQLSGNMPSELGNLINLKILNLNSDNFTGNLPSEIGNLTNLESLWLEKNNLTGSIPLTFSNLIKMQSFVIYGNQLSGDIPDIFGNWVDLIYFSIGYPYSQTHNQFTGDLNLSQNVSLQSVRFTNQALSMVDIRNGHNDNIYSFYGLNNPNLTCIFVDDAAYSTANWTHIDSTTHFVETQAECDALNTLEFDQELIALYPNPVNNVVYIQNNGLDIKNIEVQNLTGQTILNSNNQTQIDLSTLSSGMYLIKITDQNDKIGVYKVIKE